MPEVNPDVGLCPCPMCRRDVPVRRNKAGKLYLVCDFRREGAGGCGMLTPNLNDGQEWVRKNARPLPKTEPAGAAPVTAQAAPEPAPKPAAAPVNDNEAKPAPKTGGGFWSARIL